MIHICKICINTRGLVSFWPQTEMSGTGKAQKKSSNSGGAKKAMGDRRNEQSEAGLGFFGAGGHVRISGILNLSAFGVLQPPSMSVESSVK